MRYMRWDYPALMACPTDYLSVIDEEAKRELRAYRERELAGRRRR